MTLVLVTALFVVVVLAGAFAARPRVTSRLYAGTGLDDWRRVAAGLPWRDRWTLHRANASGRAAPAPLAPLAVRRGEVMVACVESSIARSSTLRKLWVVLGVLALLVCALNVALVVSGEREWHTWLQVVTQGALAVMWFSTPRLQRRQLRRLTRSVERNRALLAEQQDLPTA